jgi:CubicO group peptidase (beta-lactamase class C family)
MFRIACKALLATVMLAMPIAEASENSLAVRLDALVQEGMSRTQTQGLAIAVIDDGKVELVKT